MWVKVCDRCGANGRIEKDGPWGLMALNFIETVKIGEKEMSKEVRREFDLCEDCLLSALKWTRE